MKNILYTLFLKTYIAFLFLSSCNKESKTNIVDVSVLNSDTLINITDWKLLSSFYQDSPSSIEEATNYNYLGVYDVIESQIYSLNDFENISIKIESEDTSKTYQTVKIDNEGLNINDYAKKNMQTAAYLATNIFATDSSKAVLNLSAYQSAVIYLNGEMIYNIVWKKGRTFFREDFVPINLKKGENFILAKIIVSDPEYTPSNWLWQLDISGISASKDIYLQSYNNFFIRRSLLNTSDNLDIYLGPFIDDKLNISIYKENDPSNRIIFNEHIRNKQEGITSIKLSSKNLFDGIYVCEIILGNKVYKQDFFLGDLDLYVDNLWERYLKILNLTQEYKLDFEGIKHRLYLLARRDPGNADDLAEHWNRIRIPSLINLERAINNYRKKDIEQYFFLRNYHSNYWKGYYSYSVYYPKAKNYWKEKPIFIHLIDSQQEVRNWKNHYINYLSKNLTDTEMISDKLDFISVWTDCGGNISRNAKLILFEEIYNDIIKKYNVDKKNVFIVGNCGSTDFVYNLALKYGANISGIGLINPNSYLSPYFESSNNHIISMVYPKYDNIITQDTYNKVFEKIKKTDSSAQRFTHMYSTHYNAPYNYSEPIYKDLLTRKTSNK